MSNIKWEEIDLDCDQLYGQGVVSFLGGYDMPSTIGGDLETDYAVIHYETAGGGDFPMPDALLDWYGEFYMPEKRGMDEFYDVVEEEPDLKLADVAREYSNDYWKTFRGLDGLNLEIWGTNLEGFNERIQSYKADIDCVCFECCGLKYPLNIDSLTVSNWRPIIRDSFIATAEEFLNTLRGARSLKEIYEKCDEYFEDVMEWGSEVKF